MPASASDLTVDTAILMAQEDTMHIAVSFHDPQVAHAANDLAQRLNLGIEQITLVSAERVTWPDASLGCPQPGMIYAQVRQPGMRILLSAGGHIYAYHNAGKRSPFLCENPANA
jgi:hypothetical protein